METSHLSTGPCPAVLVQLNCPPCAKTSKKLRCLLCSFRSKLSSLQMMGLSQIFAIYFIFLSIISHTSIAADTLTPSQNLTDGQTLVSSNERFELGFFTPGTSRNRYLGIWYHNLPLTVVWVANKENPLTDLFGRLSLNKNGGLFLHNRSMGVVWTTNQTVGVRSPVLQLLGNGNLVIRDGGTEGNRFVWESFDYLSDTLLPGMKLGWTLSTGLNRFMQSWKSNEDPSGGDFTFRLDTPETPQLILRKRSEKQYRWGPYDGKRFSGGNELKSNPVFLPMFIYNSDEVYYTYKVLDESVLSRSVVTPLGMLQYLTWRNNSRDWTMMVTLNRFYCDRYGMCGPYGNCYPDDPNCHCLDGFIPKSPQDWRIIDNLGGCKRKYELNCSSGDGFVKYTDLKLPDKSIAWPIYSPEKCRAECLRTCACMAYTYINVHGNGSQCVVWLDELIDIRNFPDGGEELHIRMARAELDSIADAKRKNHSVIVAVIVTSTVFVMLLLGGVGWYIWRMKRATWEEERALQDNSCNNSMDENPGDDLELPIFNLATIFAATNKFSLEKKIGQGGFGPVYKGVLPDGREIAVKRLSQNSGQGLREFKNEVILIAKLQHRNLVRLLGCCIEGEERMLVYEYLPNKSLDKFIFDQIRRKLLPWKQRFNIILGIARGLLYLHQDSRLRIIHRDLKTSNILLDSEMNSKISDFGIARIFGGELTEEKTKRIIGTYGYMSPEYAMSGHFSVKSDVFSFGVIVLEIISGQKNWGFHWPDHDLNLVGHAWKLWDEENPLEFIDKLLNESFSTDEVVRCIQVALLCLQQRSEDRPTMPTVVFMLSNDNAEIPQPKEPGFCTESSSIKMDASSSGKDTSTANEVTITKLDGR
ncbi:unnamed protein product [Ilex paraguariensis]|uniref:Receptor-like serine/threonine-protein kinase n=1 Tax=Ilex paraguariensis TaxID=185542 RepID=A0ABC8R110_9AQUA